MSANNGGHLAGRLARDPEVHGTPPKSVTTFTLAVDGYDRAAGAKKADFFRCVAFGATGERLAKYVTKGSWIDIQTRLSMREWTDTSGQKHSEVSIIAEDFTFGPKSPSASAASPAWSPAPDEDDDPFSFGK